MRWIKQEQPKSLGCESKDTRWKGSKKEEGGNRDTKSGERKFEIKIERDKISK